MRCHYRAFFFFFGVCFPRSSVFCDTGGRGTMEGLHHLRGWLVWPLDVVLAIYYPSQDAGYGETNLGRLDITKADFKSTIHPVILYYYYYHPHHHLHHHHHRYDYKLTEFFNFLKHYRIYLLQTQTNSFVHKVVVKQITVQQLNKLKNKAKKKQKKPKKKPKEKKEQKKKIRVRKG